MKRIISLLLIICTAAAALSACGGSATPDSAKRKGTYTLMVYMVGSDLESDSEKASADIDEMLDCGLDLSGVNLLLYTGGSEMWYYDIPSDANMTCLLNKDEDGEPYLQELARTEKLLNMGEPDTLSSFLNYAHEHYPADRYGLICWDHGNGPLLGFGKDTQFDNDRLDAEELRKALDQSPFKGDQKLRFIGFDACLMSSIEIANILKDHAEYMIASQEKEPGDGWDYSFLNVLNESFETTDIAKRIIDSFSAYYEENSSVTSNPNLTLACMDLSKTDAVNRAMDNLFGAMADSLDNGGYYQRSIERSKLRSFGDESGSNRGLSMDLIDVSDLAEECAADFGAEAGALQNALKDFVILNESNLGSGGVSLYYPYYGTSMYEQKGSEQYTTISSSENYCDYLERYVKEWTKAREQSSTGAQAIPKADISESSLTYQLTDEQKKNFSKAYLNIYAKEKDENGYQLLLLGSRLDPDENGALHISPDQRIPTINGRKPIALVQRSGVDDVTYYETIGASLCYEEGDVLDGEFVTVNCSVKDRSDAITIHEIEYRDQSLDDEPNTDVSRASTGKNTADSSRWDSLAFPSISRIPTKDDNGVMRPFSEWESDGSYLWYDIPLSDVYSLSMQPISELPDYTADDFYYQVVIEDNSGVQHWGEPEHFDNSFEVTRITRESPHGSYTYELYPYHAKLISYEGTDEDLIIPDTVEDLPVTEIAHTPFQTNEFQKTGTTKSIASLTIENPDIVLNHVDFTGIRKIYLPNGMTEIPAYAFRSARRVEEVVIPDSVERIGYHAFDSMKDLKQLELPAGVETIGYGAFYNSLIKDGVTFKGTNKSYTVKDHMLLSQDGKLLHTVFPTQNSDLVIPDGVEEILPYAHHGGTYSSSSNQENSVEADCTLKTITFPESLKRIRYLAFSAEEFRELIFPDGLEEIGNLAFAGCGAAIDRDTSAFDQLQFGTKLKRIGYRILGGSRYNTLIVSEKNRRYAVKDNALTNKYGDADLSEIALSGSDNRELNQLEYDTYRMVTDGMDMSLYKKSPLAADNKKYNGHDYSLYLELNDANRFTYKHPGHDITLCGVDMTLPDSYTKLTQTGLTPDDEDDAAKKTIRYSDFINYKDEKGNRIKAELNDDSGKEVPIEKSLVEKLDFEKANYGTEDRSISVDFNYRGVTSKSSVQDVIKALGSPSELEMTVNEVGVTNSSFVIITLHYYAYQSTGAFTSTNFHTHEETHYISDGGCSIQFYYYPSEKKSVMTSFSLEYESE